ncbi:MAG: deoxyribonuclease IV [Pirellulales bacterium]|nr:deoxyribonuclease IV [Pirellulales bacterium]
MSIAGGYFRAVEIAHAAGCDCVQLFTKNNNQWRAKEIDDESAAKFKNRLAELGIRHPIAHDSYLINLAAPDDALWKRSVDAFVVELLRAERLAIPYVVMHPGAFTTSSEEVGLRRVVQALDEVHAQTRGLTARCLLETTAGQGSCLGWRFEHLATILDGVREPERLGVCVDTCHIFAAGYPLADPRDYQATIAELDRIVGLSRVKAFHLNDSIKGLGSRVDRHAHIGEGALGLEPFRHLLNDPRFADVPMYLETPKGARDGEDLDVINLRTLRGLLRRQKSSDRRPATKRRVATHAESGAATTVLPGGAAATSRRKRAQTRRTSHA